MSETIYCDQCGIYHPKEEMRQIMPKGGKKWRCVKQYRGQQAE